MDILTALAEVLLKIVALAIPYLIGCVVITWWLALWLRNARRKIGAIRRAISAEINKENSR